MPEKPYKSTTRSERFLVAHTYCTSTKDSSAAEAGPLSKTLYIQSLRVRVRIFNFIILRPIASYIPGRVIDKELPLTRIVSPSSFRSKLPVEQVLFTHCGLANLHAEHHIYRETQNAVTTCQSFMLNLEHCSSPAVNRNLRPLNVQYLSPYIHHHILESEF